MTPAFLVFEGYARPARPRRLRAAVAALLARLRREMIARAAIRRLEASDDFLLRDIGLTRSAIEDYVRHGSQRG